MSPMTETPPEIQDVFARRLIAGMCAGIGLLQFVMSVRFAVSIAPTYRIVFADFGVTLSAIGGAAMEAAWLPVLPAMVAVVCGLAGLAWPRKGWLLASAVSVLLAMAIARVFEYAIADARLQLTMSVSGGV